MSFPTSGTQDAYKDEARQRWGQTDAFREYAEKSKGRTKEAETALAEGMMQIFADFGQCRDSEPGSAQAQTLVQRLQAYISEHFYACTPEILNALGSMYASDAAFTKTIDNAGGKGTAAFAARAISIFCGQ